MISYLFGCQSVRGVLKPTISLLVSRCKTEHQRHFSLSMSLLGMEKNEKGDLPCISAILFDMDGTLTVPYLNFRKLKEDLSMPYDKDILDYVNALPESEKRKAFEIIEAFEEDGLNHLKFQPGFCELFKFLSSRTSLKRGLVTRNNRTAVNFFLEKASTYRTMLESGEECATTDIHLFDQILTRDFKPVKPAPDPILHICSKWDVSPQNAIFVGDNADDMTCGKLAGAWTILVRNDSNASSLKLADYSVDTLDQIITILSKNFEIS